MNRIRKIYCNTCRTDTNHRLEATHLRYVTTSQMQHYQFVERVQLEEPLRFEENEAVFVYNLWICLGCDTATLQEACTSEVLASDDGTQVAWTYDFFPRRSKGGWCAKSFSMPLKLGITYREVVESFNAGLVTLCSIGLRALLEGICVDKGITDEVAWGLDEKMDKLGEYGHIPARIVQGLKCFKFIGDSAAHRLEVPECEDLKLAIEVMEELLAFLYSLDNRARYLLGQMQHG